MADTTKAPFRFGVYLTDPEPRAVLVDKFRKAENLGYDVIGVADHLGLLAPFPTLMLAAEVTQRPRLATMVLNVGFYSPPLLARDAAALDQFSGGRLELGLGTGYVKADIDAEPHPLWRPGQRVDALERTVAHVRRLLADPTHRPRTWRPSGPPLCVAGRGKRVLSLAASEADIVGFTGFSAHRGGDVPQLADAEQVAKQVAYVRSLLGSRAEHVELNIHVCDVVPTTHRRAEAASLAPYRGLTADELLGAPTVLIGTPVQMADQLVELRERLGLTYITIGEHALDSLASVIELVR